MSTALFEHAYYIGNYMSGILYGVELVMYFTTLKHLMHHRRNRASWKFFFCYSTILLLLLTIDISVNAVWAEQMWITSRDGPGGVPVFIATQLSDWYQAWGSSAAVALVFFSDAFLIYRLYIIYGSRVWVIVLPILTYIGAFIFSVLELVASFKPGGFFFGSKSVNWGTPYYSMTIGLNIVVTALICYRLLSMSRLVRETMGEESAKPYTSIAAILIESAAPYSLTGIMFLVPYARGNLVSVALGQVWAKFTCIAPQLIVLRVVSNRAWSRETVGRVSHRIGFATNSFTNTGLNTGGHITLGEMASTGTTFAQESTKNGSGYSATTLPGLAEV